MKSSKRTDLLSLCPSVSRYHDSINEEEVVDWRTGTHLLKSNVRKSLRGKRKTRAGKRIN